MDPACLPDSQRGMRVEHAAISEGRLRVRTTGAEFDFDSSTGAGSFRQRIAAQRRVARIQIDAGALPTPELTHNGPGFAVARGGSAFDLRVNGDSLFMFHAKRPLKIRIERAIEPGFHASFRTHHLLLDELGGFGIYCSQPDIVDGFDPFASTVAHYDLPAGSVLWISVCPPKPYDWPRSVRDNVIWHWSNQNAYPSDDVLSAWSKHGNIVLLQSEMMLWKDWNLRFEPRLGPGEFARLRSTVHLLGMRFMVYTSPFYFLRGTSLEPQAMNSFEGFKNWPQGTATGENIGHFLPEIERLLKTHEPDGLYFDGQYTENPAALYLLARRTRELLGEEGLLEWHSTDALGPDRCYLPQADAYVDFILRGEGREAYYSSDDYFRYFVSGYNASNSIGVLCNNGSPPTPDLLKRLLAANGRMHTLAGWLGDAELCRIVQTEYTARLVPSLQTEVERLVQERQARIPARFAAMRSEHERLLAPPRWTQPVLAEPFAALEGWEHHASSLKPTVLAGSPEGLTITAHASTHAYVSRRLDGAVTGFTVKVRQLTDRGQGWGPGVVLVWPGGAMLRVGLRSDGKVQINTMGVPRPGAAIEERLVGRCDPPGWLFLRARRGEHFAVIESGRDGQSFERIWQIDHGGSYTTCPSEIRVGKIPYSGKAEDYAVDPGPVGVSTLADLKVY